MLILFDSNLCSYKLETSILLQDNSTLYHTIKDGCGKENQVYEIKPLRIDEPVIDEEKINPTE